MRSELGLKHTEKWVSRLNCGWAVFKDLLSSYDTVCGATDAKVKATFTAAAAKIWNKTAKKLASDFLLVTGNHSLDVESVKEFTEMKTLTPDSEKSQWEKKAELVQMSTVADTDNAYLTFPKFSTYTEGGVKVQFLDINTSMISCLDPPAFMIDQADGGVKDLIWKRCMAASGSDRLYSRQEGQNYWMKVVKGINSFANDAAWKVVRSHHPPLNVEGADMQVFWNYKETETGFTKTFLEVMNKKNVNLYLASHHHSSHIMAYQYLHANKDNMGKFKATDARKATLEPTGCHGECEVATVNARWSTQNKAGQNYLYIAVIGNSGRFLDPMETDQRTRGVLLWGKGSKKGGQGQCDATTDFLNRWGGANIVFKKESVDITFLRGMRKKANFLNIFLKFNLFKITEIFSK